MRTRPFRTLAIVAPLSLGAITHTAAAQEAAPAAATADPEQLLDQLIDEAESGAQGEQHAAQVTPALRFIARWLLTPRSAARVSVTVERVQRISRRSDTPASEGWRISMPDFTHDRVVAPPQTRAVALANAAAEKATIAAAAAQANSQTAPADAPAQATAAATTSSDD